jgi:hypothetical protein
VRANETVITPDDGGFVPGSTEEKLVYTGEVQAQPQGGCVLCGLRGGLNVTTPDDAAGSVSILSPAGEILTVSAPGASAGGSETASPFSAVQIPPALFSTMNVGRGAAASGKGLNYLCKCEKLREYAREAERILAETPTTQPESPPSEPLPVELPTVPGLELAELDIPLPFVPSAPPPGESPGPAEPLPSVSVSPPLVPVAGTGGGGVVSPS